MKTISVPLQKRSYPIWIEKGILAKIPQLLKPIDQGQKWVVFSQKKIMDFYGNLLINKLRIEGFKVEIIVLQDEEIAKSLNGLEKIFSMLIELGCDRSSTFLALGGGVVGDVTGFVAAIFMRGVDYIQIPTTLLAMVDSSIGGKTGVNLKEGKNLVGAIWQPRAVVIDPDLLVSLPKREISSAMGEVLKYGVILDRQLFHVIAENINDLLSLSNYDLLEHVICRCVKIKADIIAKDEREGDKRRILNFGHTIGHALESYFGFNIIRHGEAVAYGMLVASNISLSKLKINKDEVKVLFQTIKKLSLPKLPKFSSNKIISIMNNDKKVKDGKINFILIEKIGKSIIVDDVDKKAITMALEIL